MKIVYLTSLDPLDMNSWSGTAWHIHEALKKRNEVVVMGSRMLGQARFFTARNFSRQDLPVNHSPVFGALCSEAINRISDCDLVFLGDLQLAPNLEVKIPIVHLSDVNFHLFKDYEESGRTEEQTLAIEDKEKKVLNKYDVIIYTSEWTKRQTVAYYGIDPGKIHVVEFGANIPTPSDYKVNVQMDVCNLVFIGKNWKKKGGEKILGAFRKLGSEGFPCTLTIIGSQPQEACFNEEGLRILPFLDKTNPLHMKELCHILRESHFLVLPTEFDAFGIVFCEASAYAVPSIAADVGGVSQPVREGENGYLLPADATAEDYAEKIKSVFQDRSGYLKLRASSRREFESRLNWDIWLERVQPILENAVLDYRRKNARSPG